MRPACPAPAASAMRPRAKTRLGLRFSGRSGRASRTQQNMPSPSSTRVPDDARQQGGHGPARVVVRGNLVENLLGVSPHREDAGNRLLAGRKHCHPDCRQPQGRPACRQRDPAEYLPGGSIEQGLLFQGGLDGPQPQTGNQNNPGDGGQGMHPKGRIPSAKPWLAAAMGRVPSLLPKTGLPGAGLQVERQKEQHHDDAYSQPPARQIAPQQHPGHCGSQGQAEGQGLQRQAQAN